MLLIWTTAIVRLYMMVRKSMIGRSMSYPVMIGCAVPISTSGNRATGWPLYVTSNNKLRQHSRKMFSVDSCQFTSGPCHFSDCLKSRLYRDMEEKGIGHPPEGLRHRTSAALLTLTCGSLLTLRRRSSSSGGGAAPPAAEQLLRWLLQREPR